MNALTNAILNFLDRHPLVESVRVINYDETPAGKVELKIRCRLIRNYQFQVWLHAESSLLDYAYQLFTNRPILRWDNAPHYPHIATAPHHFHAEDTSVYESKLSGRVLEDLPKVLAEVGQWIEKEP